MTVSRTDTQQKESARSKSAFEYSKLPSQFYAPLNNAQFPEPKLFSLNESHAAQLGMDPGWLKSADGLKLLSGAATLGAEPPIAMAYAGHQFGHYSPILGDGRAMLVGEPFGPDGTRRDLHLKGSGPTPFSRGGDGKATLGSVIREYVVSEAMAALGVPTTRSLAIVTTGETVRRETAVPGAVLSRTARSHLRVGTFQFAAALGDIDHVTALADFAIDRLYPSISSEGSDRHKDFVRLVGQVQARLIAKWMSLGFIHGVMNTDNASIAGETIDYGPCAFMDTFDPSKVFSSIDHQGRYAWNRQAEMGLWNLTQLAQALLPLLGDSEDEQINVAQNVLSDYPKVFQAETQRLMSDKLGLDGEHEMFPAFMADTFGAMAKGEVDYTRFFTALTRSLADWSDVSLLNSFQHQTVGADWLEAWQKMRAASGLSVEASLDKMRGANPVRIPRNHQVEQAIRDGESGNPHTMNMLIEALKAPYTEDAEFASFEQSPEEGEIVTETFCGT